MDTRKFWFTDQQFHLCSYFFTSSCGEATHPPTTSPRMRPLGMEQLFNDEVRASPAIGSPRAKIRRYLAPNGCKVWYGEVYFPSREPRMNEFIFDK
jgi:hypothetical protein